MRRILALILGALVIFLIILAVHRPTYDFVHAALGPSITGAFGAIASVITNSETWGWLTTWPVSFGFSAAIFIPITLVAAYLWHTGWDATRKFFLRTQVSSGKAGPVMTEPLSTVTQAKPVKIAKEDSKVEEVKTEG